MPRCLSSLHLALASFARKGLPRAAPLVLFALALCLSRSVAFAEPVPEFRIIVNPDNPSASLTREFLADVYLKRVTRWPDGETVHPADQRSGAVVRDRFSDGVLKRSVAAMKRYWQQRIFAGRDLPPPELDGDEAVVSYVLKHRGGVGYVSGASKLDRTKTVPVR